MEASFCHTIKEIKKVITTFYLSSEFISHNSNLRIAKQTQNSKILTHNCKQTLNYKISSELLDKLRIAK